MIILWGYADRWLGHVYICGWTVPPLSVSQRWDCCCGLPHCNVCSTDMSSMPKLSLAVMTLLHRKYTIESYICFWTSPFYFAMLAIVWGITSGHPGHHLFILSWVLMRTWGSPVLILNFAVMCPSPEHVFGRLLDSSVVRLAERDNDLPEPALSTSFTFSHLFSSKSCSKSPRGLQMQLDRLHINGEEENTELEKYFT